MEKIDPVTGNAYDREFASYVYHYGMTEQEATAVMAAKTYGERDVVMYVIGKKRVR